MANEQLVYFLLGILQLVGIGLTSWALLTLVRVLERLAKMDTKIDAFPLSQIQSNRHRIENLERSTDLHTEQIANLRARCQELHAPGRACG